jgi:hypothetical protein
MTEWKDLVPADPTMPCQHGIEYTYSCHWCDRWMGSERRCRDVHCDQDHMPSRHHVRPPWPPMTLGEMNAIYDWQAEQERRFQEGRHQRRDKS